MEIRKNIGKVFIDEPKIYEKHEYIQLPTTYLELVIDGRCKIIKLEQHIIEDESKLTVTFNTRRGSDVDEWMFSRNPNELINDVKVITRFGYHTVKTSIFGCRLVEWELDSCVNITRNVSWTLVIDFEEGELEIN